ncbi:excinuclease ABC subunit UvrA [bacterium]|nr:MAG: excinuclease ABC subunit UvrA [bacterium]
MQGNIKVRGARVNNLKNIDVDIPLGSFTVVTGVSGSGKSSLVFDTIYAEGRRKYFESLSYYARYFLGDVSKPDVDKIEGLSPAISIDQKVAFRNPRSTLGTITEIYDLLRVLFAKLGRAYCPSCKTPLSKMSPVSIANHIIKDVAGIKDKANLTVIISAVVTPNRGNNMNDVLNDVLELGFSKIVLNDKTENIKNVKEASVAELESIEIVVDTIIAISDEIIEKERIVDSITSALELASNNVISVRIKSKKEFFSNKNICLNCGQEMPELSPRLFSFNSPEGACPSCTGPGKKMSALPELVIPNDSLTIAEGAIKPWRKMGIGNKTLNRLADEYNFSLHEPVKQLNERALKVMLYGEDIPGGFEGVLKDVEKRYRQASTDFLRGELEEYLIEKECDECKGKRLNPFALSVFIGRRNIDDFVSMPIDSMIDFLKMDFQFNEEEKLIANAIIKEIIGKLKILQQIGLGYLTLSRTSVNLSGGEIQRARLAKQLGTELSGILYVLDEPTVGLHPRDIKLITNALQKLKKDGNTILVVEHDKQVMEEADYLIDVGPGAGENGGMIVAKGTLKDLEKAKTFTGAYLSGESEIVVKKNNNNHSKRIIIEKAEENNLKKVDAIIPQGCFVCVSGVSGSGKSTLVEDILAKALLKKLYNAKENPGKFKKITGADNIKRVINIDQSPIGRTPRSNPATYTGAFTMIRDIFANSEYAKIKGLRPGHFSFNVKGGRCEACQGAGEKKMEMHFLQDVYVKCEECGGERYLPEILKVKYRGLNISNVLSLTIDQAFEFFSENEKLSRKLKFLSEVGLGYLKLGQSAMTFSGGEAQRIKLATELSKKLSEDTLYILDEPTTGLHFEDIKKLLKLLLELVKKGSTVVVIEHNLDILKNADWIIDLGPDGGEKGGEIVVQGPPCDIVKEKRSVTGKFLKKVL